MGEKKFLKGMFSIGSSLGVIPKIKSFQYSELINYFEKSQFEIIEAECLVKKTQQYFIVAKKKY